MIVDDEPRIVEGIQKLLNWEDYDIGQVITATDGEEALRKAMEYRPNIGIFDVCIGPVKGYELIETLNRFALPAEYIMVSGYDEFEFARKAIQAGAKDYLLKPVGRAELGRAVAKIVTEDFHGNIRSVPADESSVDPVLRLPYASFSNLIGRVLLLIRVEYSRNVNLRVIAEKFKMNSNYLGQMFLKETHLKFSEYLMAYRMIRARKAIEGTTEKIYNIAREVGYSNTNYFHQHFRSYFGVSPSDLRNPGESAGETGASPKQGE